MAQSSHLIPKRYTHVIHDARPIKTNNCHNKLVELVDDDHHHIKRSREAVWNHANLCKSLHLTFTLAHTKLFKSQSNACRSSPQIGQRELRSFDWILINIQRVSAQLLSITKHHSFCPFTINSLLAQAKNSLPGGKYARERSGGRKEWQQDGTAEIFNYHSRVVYCMQLEARARVNKQSEQSSFSPAAASSRQSCIFTELYQMC